MLVIDFINVININKRLGRNHIYDLKEIYPYHSNALSQSVIKNISHKLFLYIFYYI